MKRAILTLITVLVLAATPAYGAELSPELRRLISDASMQPWTRAIDLSDTIQDVQDREVRLDQLVKPGVVTIVYHYGIG